MQLDQEPLKKAREKSGSEAKLPDEEKRLLIKRQTMAVVTVPIATVLHDVTEN